MKQSVLILAIVFSALTIKAQDLPNPAANLQTLPSGSYVIPMDNTLQNDVALGSSGKFNLRSYGLVVHLLNYNVKVKWVIKAGKAKDGIDFTATAQMFKPTLEGSSSSRNFVAGPFVIFAADTLGVASLVNNFYSQHGLTSNNRPKVFRTITSTSNVDIRYNLTGFKPKAAILDDGGNEDIHIDYMIAASIPVMNYEISNGTNLQSNCFTFASEPHNSQNNAEVDSAIVHIKDFVLSGRNFLAECAAIRTYENNPLGRFQTINGINDVNGNLGTNVTFQHPDLAYYQIQGTYNASTGGSVKNWQSIGGQSTTSFSKANGQGTNINTHALTLAKLTDPSTRGGMVFYLGNHRFTGNSEAGLNGIRIYLNAFMTPVGPNSYCETDPNVLLPLKLTSFQGYLTNNKVTLNWTVAENQYGEQFKVERSIDGQEFSSAALVFNSEKNGDESYGYFELMPAPKSFYRLRMTDKSGVLTYSKVLMFESTALVANDLKLLNNPVQDKLNFKYETGTNATVEIRILDLTGRPVFLQKLNASKGTNMVSLPIPPTLTKGMYIIAVQDGAVQRSAKFVKN